MIGLKFIIEVKQKFSYLMDKNSIKHIIYIGVVYCNHIIWDGIGFSTVAIFISVYCPCPYSRFVNLF